ncbi:MAG TPA: ABC transporter permease [Chloroflexota bacterium]|nr:ABC transporter permease [Chloroflexota bacterium]
MTPSPHAYSAELAPPPGSGVLDEPAAQRGASGWRRWWWRYRSSPIALFGLAVVAVLVLAGLLAPWITAYPADAGSTTNFAATLLAPSGTHPFGTDDVGRDILTRVIFGARISLSIAFAVTICAAAIGVAIGGIAAYYGRWAQWILMGLTDSFLALPILVMAIAIAAILGHGTANLVGALILVWWPGYARLTEGLVLAEKQREYVEAARAMGVPSPRTLWRHVLPNIVAPIIIRMGQDIGYVILTAAGLGFVGLGVQPPTPEWGVMVSESRQFMLQAWWYSLFPGVAIAVAVLGFTLVGNGLQAAFNVHHSDASR